jgi:hypothetical protein
MKKTLTVWYVIFLASCAAVGPWLARGQQRRKIERKSALLYASRVEKN